MICVHKNHDKNTQKMGENLSELLQENHFTNEKQKDHEHQKVFVSKAIHCISPHHSVDTRVRTRETLGREEALQVQIVSKSEH